MRFYSTTRTDIGDCNWNAWFRLFLFDSLLYYGLGIERDLRRDHVRELKIRWRGVRSKSNDSTWHGKPSKSNGNKKFCNRKCKKSNVFPPSATTQTCTPPVVVWRENGIGPETVIISNPSLSAPPENEYGKSFRHVLYRHSYSHGVFDRGHRLRIVSSHRTRSRTQQTSNRRLSASSDYFLWALHLLSDKNLTVYLPPTTSCQTIVENHINSRCSLCILFFTICVCVSFPADNSNKRRYPFYNETPLPPPRPVRNSFADARRAIIIIIRYTSM